MPGEPKINAADSGTESLLGKLKFFEDFPEELKRQIHALSELRKYSPQQTILTQGQINTFLYFLISGRVSVYVDEGLVAHLDQPGDLLGEMSVISNAPCAATIRADTEVELLAIDAQALQNISGPNQVVMEKSLFKIYSLILAEKLRITNGKAKHFEKMSLELGRAKDELQKINEALEQKVAERTRELKQKSDNLEQQNAALLASHRKMEELYSNRDLTFSKLEKLHREILPPLEKSLAELAGPQNTPLLSRAKDEISAIVGLLEPVTHLYSMEKRMRSQRVLLVESSRKQQVVAKMALGGTGVELDVASTLEEAQALLEQKTFDIIFFDSQMLPLMEMAVQKLPKVKLVLMTSQAIPEYLDLLSRQPFLPNIVSRDENDRVFSIKNIMTTVSKLANFDIFGLEKYLTWGIDVQEHVVSRSNEREDMIQKMDQYFSQVGIRKSNRDRSATVAEELLMNAIYDAPTDQNGKSLYNHLSRKEEVILAPEHSARLRYASDGMLMAVSVEDPFGALTGKIVLDYLESCYGQRAGELNKEKGGAGRGLHLIVESSDLVVFNVHPGKKTEVISLINVDPKDQGEKNPSFHFFSLATGEAAGPTT